MSAHVLRLLFMHVKLYTLLCIVCHGCTQNNIHNKLYNIFLFISDKMK